MQRDAAELLRDALSLPSEARAALIDSLLDSLDVEVDENAEEAWREEISRRLQQIDSGAVKLIPWHDAQRRLRARLDRRREDSSKSILRLLRKRRLRLTGTRSAADEPRKGS